MESMSAADTKKMLAGIKVIDVDTHLTEPHDLWTKRATPSLRDRVPQVKTLANGQRAWVIDGDKSIGNGAMPHSAIRRDGSKPAGLGYQKWQIEECHEGSYDVRARLEVMDQAGIWAQVVYPNTLGFGGQKAAEVDPALRLAATQIYNDAVGEMQEESGNRIFPMALLPWWDVDLSVKETQRANKMGLRGININSDPQGRLNPEGRPLPDLGDLYWDPLWAVCSELNMPVNFHIGASEEVVNWVGEHFWPSLKRERVMIVGSMLMFTNNSRVLANLIMSGICDRYPDLKFVSVESGLGWIPFTLETLDYQYSELSTRNPLAMKPSDYFKRNFYACFWFEQRDLNHMVKKVGVDNVMFETDFPHPTCLYPNPLERGAKTLEDFDKESRFKILSGNASRVYSIPV